MRLKINQLPFRWVVTSVRLAFSLLRFWKVKCPVMQSPKNTVRGMLVCLILSVCFLNYWQYSRAFQTEGPDQYTRLINGTADAPQQYRILVVRAAWFVHKHSPLGMRHAFCAFDTLAALLAGWILLVLLEHSAAFRRRGLTEQCLAYALFLFLFAYYLIWLDWYQRPETLPTTCFLTLMVALLCWKPTTSASFAVISAGTLVLVLLQALTRADVAFCFYAGVFIYVCLNKDNPLPGPRFYYGGLAAIAAISAVAIQLLMSKHIYPHATYGDTAVFQLKKNLVDPFSVSPFILFMVPAAWTCWFTLRKRPSTEAPWLALLLGASVFLPLWMVVGRIQEVRIFLPFAVALIPLTVNATLEAFIDSGQAAV
jgi:hypothetical protein